VVDGGAGVIISATPPADPADGQVWENSTNGQRYVWWDGQEVWVAGSGVSDIDPRGQIGAQDVSTIAGTSHVFTAADNGKIIRCTNDSAVTVLVPLALPDYFSATLVQMGGGTVLLGVDDVAIQFQTAMVDPETTGQYSAISIANLGTSNTYLIT
jgi:hypothetical protein